MSYFICRIVCPRAPRETIGLPSVKDPVIKYIVSYPILPRGGGGGVGALNGSAVKGAFLTERKK